jgi:Flp pilus assembly protein TadD
MAQMRIFVSHSHEDDAFCRALVDGLRRAGADVWYDEHNLGSGQLLDTIEAELRDRPVFVLVLSPAALASPWVRDETKWAFTRLRREPNRILLPVLASTVEEGDIWLFLQDFKRVEAPGITPFPLAEAVTRTLHALQLTQPGEAPLPIAPQPAESAEDLVARGKALQAQGKHVEALPLFQRATQLDPRSFDAWANISYTLIELKRYEQSLAACERALALYPNSVSGWTRMGAALIYLKRYDEALAAAEQALALDPKSAAAWYNKGTALIELQRYEQTQAGYDPALPLDPNHHPHRYEEAVGAYDQALALDPNSARTWHNRAVSLRALGRTSEAKEAARRAKELGG